MTADGRPPGDPDVAAFLRDIERSIEVDCGANQRSLQNHLDSSNQVIANIAALKNLNDNAILELIAKGNPT